MMFKANKQQKIKIQELQNVKKGWLKPVWTICVVAEGSEQSVTMIAVLPSSQYNDP